MNPTHRALVAELRRCSAIEDKISQYDDAALLRQMLRNLRGIGDRAVGMRLSKWGVDLMRKCFRPYEIERDGAPVGPLDLVFLDRTAQLPYYILTNRDFVMFDANLAIKLKLAEGLVSTLIEIDGMERQPRCR